MREVIDLISSDPPLPEDPKSSTHVSPKPRPAPAGLAASLGLISSDSIFDVSGFSDFVPDQPAKKRRLSGEQNSTVRQTNVARAAQLVDAHIFSFSDDDQILPPSKQEVQTLHPEREVDDFDPIIFTSSAPEPSRRPVTKVTDSTSNRPDPITLDDDSDDESSRPPTKSGGSRTVRDEIRDFSDPFVFAGADDPFSVSSDEDSAPTSQFSSRTAALLSAIETEPTASGNGSGKGISAPAARKSYIAIRGNRVAGGLSDDLDEPEPPRPLLKKSGKLSAEEKEARAKARAEAKAQKDFERKLEKERKQKLKEEKAREKQLAADLADVNKLKTDKKNSTAEMILDMSISLKDTSVGNQSVEYMKRLNVEHHFFTGPIRNVVKWRRKMNAKYNDEVGHWEPAPFHIAEEKQLLCLVPAQEFVDMLVDSAAEAETESLEEHVLKLKSAYPGFTIIYLIEGLTSLMRKHGNARNRAYVAEVLRQTVPETTVPEETTTSRRGRKPKRKPEDTPPVDPDLVEDGLLELQVAHSCLIHHTAAPPESAEWIKLFTEHISTNLYRWERSNAHDASFCMETGQVKTGDGKQDTFVKMLQEVNRVTASMAYGIAAQYSCVTDLVQAMQMRGPGMLEDVKKSANRNGALSDARIGPAASRRLYKVFTGLDPSSTDI
ncbi:hypothetical protein POX_d05438 [Penicillium oxalicum]|uniref:ERCC4 domain-containing protein n=1 Tax=Penicillium oxalicum (strain 114-2 / CGMCC 5302) TaxID=933388 RepID=S8B0V6_PENO1|nr:hypothetical protein POX_d05438 [Penicillium oxalicum]EPS32398.1 hypothetical protein PDE_07358 [Penicillium oxalicum 114-2]KAI2789938.1 hypothetical protein POX_d05438 [Penicillium oxalicum]